MRGFRLRKEKAPMMTVALRHGLRTEPEFLKHSLLTNGAEAGGALKHSLHIVLDNQSVSA